jgi:hypothetical protein
MPVPEHAVHYLEIVTPDVEAACDLYGTAYGWRFEATGAELGNSFVATLLGARSAALRPDARSGDSNRAHLPPSGRY